MNGIHASFFSGAGGLDLGLERAGWRTVSFSEIDPYASAVLAQRWPGVPNLGSITAPELHASTRGGPLSKYRGSDDWTSADLWSGGFPCQDLSVAGKRRGLAGSRSGLAFAFLDLVGRHRPRFVLLENVPGLLSSHGGKDFGTLLAAMVELGYGVGYRVLDARYFGVPQRRRRVFILGDSTGGRAGAEFAAEVLSVGSRCRRHPPTGIEAGPGVAAGAPGRPDIVGPLDTALGHHGAGWPDQSVHSGHLIGSSPDPRGVREADGLAGRSHDRGGVDLVQGGESSYHQRDRVYGTESPSLDANGRKGAPLISTFVKRHRAASTEDAESWSGDDTAPTLNDFDTGDSPAVTLAIGGRGMTDDPLLPVGLDSHRYRCCGNGVVADVGEWIGARLLAAIEAERAA